MISIPMMFLAVYIVMELHAHKEERRKKRQDDRE